MKTANLIIDWLLSNATCHRTEMPPSPFHQIWKKGSRISIHKLFGELEKIWKCNLGFSKISISHLFLWIGKKLEIYKAPGQHFKIQMLNLWMSWESLCPNLSFTVENKIRNLHKSGWSNFKLNMNDWDIPLPKILRIYQWIGKNIFHLGKWNEPIKLVRECVRLKVKI